jgi:hypothetical protein
VIAQTTRASAIRSVPHRGFLVRIRQPLQAVRAHGLQHPVPRGETIVAFGHAQDRLIDQAGQRGQHRRPGRQLVGADVLGGGQGGPAGENGQPARQHLLGRRQQLPAPVDDRPERPVLGQRRPAAPGQQCEPVVQALRELIRGQRAEPHGSQLDRQRHPVEGPADPGHRGRVGLAELEIRPDRHRAVAQQPD